MAKDGIKDRKFQGILYPDSESYCCEDVLNVLKSTFPEFAYILHDKDTDENGECGQVRRRQNLHDGS